MLAPYFIKNFKILHMNKLFALLVLFVLCFVIFPTSGYADTGNKVNNNSRLNKTNAKMDDSIIGSWAGKHISIEVTGQGAKIEYDCASGTIDKKIILDKNHHFNVLGTHTEEHGGPIRQNEQSNSYPVRLIGRIKGKKMTLIVKRKDNNKIIGSFILVRGQESFLVKCR
jgi:predicted GNAT family N-acyltransferase